MGRPTRPAEKPDWRTFNARSLLGATLLAQKKYGEAESFLLSGYAGMKEREEKIPVSGKVRLKEGLKQVVQLYELTGRPALAKEWSQKLQEFEPAQTNRIVPASLTDPPR